LGANPSSLRRVNIINYFVDADSRLIRRVFGVQNAGFIDSVIAEHIVTLQFRYILEPSADGTIFEQPISSLQPNQASRVRMIEPNISVETAYALQDGQKRQVEGTTQVGVRNIQFLKAPVPVDAQGNSRLLNPGPTPEITPPPDTVSNSVGDTNCIGVTNHDADCTPTATQSQRRLPRRRRHYHRHRRQPQLQFTARLMKSLQTLAVFASRPLLFKATVSVVDKQDTSNSLRYVQITYF
jgi:hypothetical protein